MPQKSPPLPCLIVLGARINQDGLPGRIARMRVEHALKIWQEDGATGFVILTGGCSREGLTVSEARVMADYALSRAEEHGGQELRERLNSCLLLEEASLTTWDSACHTLPLLLNLDLSAVGLISDFLHLRRAYFLFSRHYRGHSIRLHTLPVPGVIRHYWRNRRYLWLTRMAIRETGAWLKVLTRRTHRKKR